MLIGYNGVLEGLKMGLEFDDFDESSEDWQTSISNHSGIAPHNGNYQDNYSFE